MTQHDHDFFDGGLAVDLPRLLGRRTILAAGVTGLVAAACGSTKSATTPATAAPASTPATTEADTPSAAAPTDPAASAGTSVAVDPTGAATGTEACVGVIPEETPGPFPADGSNGPDVLTQDGVIRQDLRASFGESTTIAEGVPLTIRLTLVDATDGCTPIQHLGVYLWHCSREGRYSMYSDGAENENYLRGVQPSLEGGVVTFQTIFPGCYPGRWPHAHFEIYDGVDEAIQATGLRKTSQLALPADICAEVYETVAGYESSIEPFSRMTFEGDNIFANPDGGIHQLGTISGSITDGLVVDLTVGIDPTA